MTEVIFGTLEDVAVRAAWTHEATVFTPWLASNLDRLGRELGLELQLEGQEVRVGRFAADILARDVRTNDRVLIENQLEEGDHRHLGQILTYLTGLDAKTVVWVAPAFRDEHLSAVRWLNQHASDGASFFAVKLRVVRIGDSAFAPLFEVLERPNDWDRRLQEVANEVAEQSPASARRQAFWDHAVQRHPGSGLTPASSPGRWVPTGVADVVISAWVGEHSVGVFLRGGRGRGEATLEQVLIPNAAALAARLGVELGEAAYPFASRLEIDLADRSTWDRATDWLAERIALYAAAARHVLEGLS